jgi:hypothetical protein
MDAPLRRTSELRSHPCSREKMTDRHLAAACAARLAAARRRAADRGEAAAAAAAAPAPRPRGRYRVCGSCRTRLSGVKRGGSGARGPWALRLRQPLAQTR